MAANWLASGVIEGMVETGGARRL